MNTNENSLEEDYNLKLNEIEQKLKNYILENYDVNNKDIALKFTHTFQTRLVNDKITESLNLTKRQCYLASLIALFHDYARFEQVKKYATFSDLKSVDHADLAVEMLFDKAELENFIDDLTENEKQIMYFAIKNHNKFAIQSGLTDEQMLFCKIIRDADKLDIFRIVSCDPRCEKLEVGQLIEEELENFYSHKLYKKTVNMNLYSKVLCHLSLIYDLNFNISCEILLNSKYIKMYMYSILLWATFKIDEDIIDCADYAEKYLKDRLA